MGVRFRIAGVALGVMLALNPTGIICMAQAAPLNSESDINFLESNIAIDQGKKTGSLGDSPAFLGPDSPVPTAGMSYPSFPLLISGTQRQADAQSMLSMVNNLRASKGVPALKWSKSLELAAIQRSAEISLFFDHARPDGSDCFTVPVSDLYFSGENIAGGFNTSQQAFEGWKSSPGHYANMIRDSFTHVGIACFVDSSGTASWVQCFGIDNQGRVDETRSTINSGIQTVVSLRDKAITGASWTVNAFTPGVGSMRGLPSVKVTFKDTFPDKTIYGDVSYDWDMFDWSTQNENIARFVELHGSYYALGVSVGKTSYLATFPTTSKLNKTFPVTVTKDGSFTDVTFGKTDHYTEIIWLSGSGVTSGFNDGSFRPYAEVARCDMAAFLRRLAISAGLEDASTWKPGDADWARFKDVNRQTPHAEDILWLAHAGVSEGFSDGGFHPYATVVRQDMAAFLRRLARKSSSSDASGWVPSKGDWGSFVDVGSKTPHVEDVLWLAHAGISNGFPGKRFSPLGTVKRCDMAAFLQRLYKDMSN